MFNCSFEKELPDVLNKENAKGEYSDVVYYNLGQPSGYTETQLNTHEVLDISDVVEEVGMDENYANSSIVQYYGDGKSYLMPLKTTPAGSSIILNWLEKERNMNFQQLGKNSGL